MKFSFDNSRQRLPIYTEELKADITNGFDGLLYNSQTETRRYVQTWRKSLKKMLR